LKNFSASRAASASGFMRREAIQRVVAGLVPAIHVFGHLKDVDTRDVEREDALSPGMTSLFRHFA